MVQRVSLSTTTTSKQVNVSKDSSGYYSYLAKQWAVGEGEIEDNYFSSRHYALEASKQISETTSALRKEVEHQVQLARTEAQKAEEKANELLSASKAETDLSNLTENGINFLKTNTYAPPLGSFAWFDHAPENTGWAVSNFEWLNKGYEGFWKLLIEQYNAGSDESETIGNTEISYKKTPNGWKIVTTDELDNINAVYLATGRAWYYLLDLENEQFRLPRQLSSALTRSSVSKTVPVIGTGYGIGLYTGESDLTLVRISNTSGVSFASYNANPLPFTQPNGGSIGANQGVGISLEASKSGIIADLSSVLTETDFKLYFYLGDSTANLSSDITGKVLEQINNKIDIDGRNAEFPVITDKYVNGTSWYRVWSDGWCEQGGINEITGSGTIVTIELIKPYRDTNYFITRTGINGTSFNPYAGYISGVYDISPDNFKYRTDTPVYAAQNRWKTEGYLY